MVDVNKIKSKKDTNKADPSLLYIYIYHYFYNQENLFLYFCNMYAEDGQFYVI
jgi:hypothetical protein